MVVLIAVVGVFFASGSSRAEPAEEKIIFGQGLELLKNHQLEKAQSVWHQIPFQSPLWPEKAIVLMRFQLEEKNFDEVFRIYQLLRKVGRHNEESERLVKLASFLHGHCTLRTFIPDDNAEVLLEAATFRFYERFNPQGETGFGDRMREWETGTFTWSVSPFDSPFLSEIPELKLLPPTGCHNLLKKFSNPRTRATEELQRLMKVFTPKWFTDHISAPENSTPLLILARVLELKILLAQDFSTERGLLDSVPLENLKGLPEPELRWLWSMKVPSLKPINNFQTQFIFDLLEEAPSADRIDWLSLVSVEALPLAKRIKLLKSLLAFPELENHPFLTYMLAQAYWQVRQPKETLGMIRKLLILNKVPLDPEAENAVVELASRVFSEIQSDQKALGAFHASVPHRLWKNYSKNLVKQLAIKGDSKKLNQWLQGNQVKNVITEDQTKLWKALAVRNVKQFRDQLREMLRRGRLSNKLQEWLMELASESLKLNEQEQKSMAPFYGEIVQMLKNSIESATKADTESQQQLLHTFSTVAQNAWVDGNALVRNEVVQVGTVKLEKKHVLPNPFEFRIPKTLPLRNFIYVPEGLAGRQWKLE